MNNDFLFIHGRNSRKFLQGMRYELWVWNRTGNQPLVKTNSKEEITVILGALGKSIGEIKPTYLVSHTDFRNGTKRYFASKVVDLN